jgi:hypothetical protein
MDKPEDLLISGSGLITKKWTQKLARLLKSLEINSVVGGTLSKSIHGQSINVKQRHKPQQFDVTWLQGAQPKAAINTGYVFASYDDGNSTYLPMRNQHPFEPYIGNNLLSASTPPTLSLTVNNTNYIYLKLTWDFFEDDIGGEPFGGNHAFKAEYGLEVFDTQDGYYYAVQDSSQGSGSYTQGIYTPIKKRTYYLNTAEFVVETDQTQATDTEDDDEAVCFILAGYATLNGSGVITTSSTNEGARWYLEGPVYTSRPPAYISNISPQHANHRTEPVTPATPSGQTVPGIS